jgi:anthranilate phosphoribosyltransferase
VQQRGDAFLMRGTEGETVANANKAQQIDWFHEGQRTLLVEKQGTVQTLPVLPGERDAAVTAEWIGAVLGGEMAVPEPIAEQVAQCLRVAEAIRARGAA